MVQAGISELTGGGCDMYRRRSRTPALRNEHSVRGRPRQDGLKSKSAGGAIQADISKIAEGNRDMHGRRSRSPVLRHEHSVRGRQSFNSKSAGRVVSASVKDRSSRGMHGRRSPSAVPKQKRMVQNESEQLGFLKFH